MLRHLGVYIVKHFGRVQERPFSHRSVSSGFLPRTGYFPGVFLDNRLVLLFRPVTLNDEMLFQPLDRVTKRKGLPFVFRPILRGVVTR